MMQQSLKEILHWIRLILFKQASLRTESLPRSRRDMLTAFLKIYPLIATIGMITLIAIGGALELAGHYFNWRAGQVFFLVIGLGIGLGVGLDIVVVGSVVSGLVGGLIASAIVGLVGGLIGGVLYLLGGANIGYAVADGLTLVLMTVDLGISIGVGLGIGRVIVVKARSNDISISAMVGGLISLIPLVAVYIFGALACGIAGSCVGLVLGSIISNAVGTTWTEIRDRDFNLAVCYLTIFSVVYSRVLYLVPYMIQYRQRLRAPDPISLFRQSPAYWAPSIILPLPYLSNWLKQLIKHNREVGLIETLFIAANRPIQRRAAQKALIAIAVEDLQQLSGLDGIAQAGELLQFIPSDTKLVLPGIDEARTRAETISQLARDYMARLTPVGQRKVLDEMHREVDAFGKAMALTKAPVGPTFQIIAVNWLGIVTQEISKNLANLSYTSIYNPFIAGNPLEERDHDLFKGRRDIILSIEENIINPSQRSALLFYGRRRTGKTSTLLNLPRLLSSQFIPVYINLQDAEWRDGDGAFCYHLVSVILKALVKRGASGHVDLKNPALEEFDKLIFTRLNEYLDRIENISRRIGKQLLLTFDEYEQLEEGFAENKISQEILNQMRVIVQHRERIVVLFSGSHRFSEWKRVNWSNYLIDVKTIELSFLAPEEGRELIERPTPGFNLDYEPGVVERILELTNCQPYLLQAVGSDLVHYLNTQKRTIATVADMEVAAERVLVTSQGYFYNIWIEDCSELERAQLLAIAGAGSGIKADPVALLNLCHKEIIKHEDERWKLTVELFRRWILKDQVIHNGGS